MPRPLSLLAVPLLVIALPATVVVGQTPAAPPVAPFYAVSYVDVAASSAATAATALARYRDESRAHDGFTSAEFFEQIGRPGHFAVVEIWRDQAIFDARAQAARQQLLAALDPIRVSGYDERPYKTLDVADAGTTTAPGVVFVVSHVDVAPNPQVPVLLARQAAASRQEPGNLRFDVVQHTMRANHFTVIEAWRDQQALDAHVAAAHTRRYRDELQPFTGSPLDERVYRAVN